MIHGDAPFDSPIPITKPAIPLSEPCSLPLASAIAIEAHGPIPAAAIIKPTRVKVGDDVKTTIAIPRVTEAKQYAHIRGKLNSFFVER